MNTNFETAYLNAGGKASDLEKEDGAGCIYPYFGLAPHTNDPWIENFSPDVDGTGVYTHCLYCGADGSEMDLPKEVVKSLKEGS